MRSDSRTFEKLLDNYFNTYYREHPADAAHVGLCSGESRFNPATLNALRRQQTRRRVALAKLDTIAPSALTNEQNLDRLAFRTRLLRECEEFDRGRHELDPDGIEKVLGLLLKELQSIEDGGRK